MSALLLSLAGLSTYTSATGGKKQHSDACQQSQINQESEPTWNGKPISQELRLVHLPAEYGRNMPDWKQYWKVMAEENPEAENLEDRLTPLENEQSYVFLVDSKDTILGYCTYRQLGAKKPHEINKWLGVIPKSQVYNTMCCDWTCLDKKLKGYGIGLAMLRKAIQQEEKNKTWVLYDLSSASANMNYHVYSKLGFERAMKNTNGVSKPMDEYEKAGDYIRQGWHKQGLMVRYPDGALNRLKAPTKEIHNVFRFLDQQNKLSEKSIKRCDSLAYETLQNKLTQKKYEEKLNKKKKYEETHPQYEERRKMKKRKYDQQNNAARKIINTIMGQKNVEPIITQIPYKKTKKNK